MITYQNYPTHKHEIKFDALPAAVKKIVPNLEALDEYYELYNDDETIAQGFDKVLSTYNEVSNKIVTAVKKELNPGPTIKKNPNLKTKPVKKTTVTYKFKKGDYVQKTKNTLFKGRIIEPITHHPDLHIAYSVKTDNGSNENWFETDLEMATKGEPSEIAKPSKVAKAKPARTKPAKAQAKAPKKAIVTKPKHGHALVPVDIKLLRRVKNLFDKTKTRQDFLVVLNAIERADVERSITKKSQYAKELNYSLDWLRKCVKHIGVDGGAERFAPKDKEMMADIITAATGHEVLEAVSILKQYIRIQGRKDSKVAAGKLLTRLEKYETSGTKPGHYSQHLKDIKKALKNYLNSQSPTMAITSYALSGIAENCGCTLASLGYIDTFDADNLIPPPKKRAMPEGQSSSGFGLGEIVQPPLEDIVYNLNQPGDDKPDPNDGGTPLDQVKASAQGFMLAGDIGKFLGPIALNRYACVIKGDPGAGKSRLLLQIANAMAAVINKQAIFSMEMSPQNPTIKKEYFDKYIAPQNRPLIITYEQGSLSKIKELAAKGVRSILIDSWQKLYEKGAEFGILRDQRSGTAFFVIFQETSGGKARGGSESIYDADLIIHCHKDPSGDYKKNYAQCEKNRFAGTDMRYNIFTGKLM